MGDLAILSNVPVKLVIIIKLRHISALDTSSLVYCQILNTLCIIELVSEFGVQNES